MIGGIIAGALSGAGQAMQENADNTLAQRREQALLKMRNEFTTSEREASQKYATSEREAQQGYQTQRDATQQGYTQDNARLQHGLNMEQTRYTQGQQNARHASSLAERREAAARGDRRIVPLEGGGYGLYNATTNTLESLPEGMGNPNGNTLSDVQKKQIDVLSGQLETLNKKEAEGFPLSTQEKLRKGELGAMLNQLLGLPGGGGNLADGVANTLEGVAPSGGQPPVGSQPESAENGGNGLVGRAQDSASREAQVEKVEAALEDVDQRIQAIASGSANRGGFTSFGGTELTPEMETEGRRLMAELTEMQSDPLTTARLKSNIRSRMRELSKIGITLSE